MRKARIGVDIGGTFTDLVLLDSEGQVFFTKVSSTPPAPEEAVLTGVAKILEQAGLAVGDVTEVLHGTTVGSNTLLQKVGAKTGLITTKGFRDVLEIGRVRTPTMFDLTWSKGEPLVERRFRMEVDERINAKGEVLRPLDPAEVIEIGAQFKAEGIESVAICFLNSYLNPANEQLALDTFAAHFPDIWVTASVSVLPEIKEYERTSTTAVNAYVLPSLRHYLTRLEGGLQSMGVHAPLLVSNSNGGLSGAKVAQDRPVFFISSGRSAGVVGGARLAASVGEPDLVVFDMGGTTASASLVHKGEVTRTSEYEFRSGISTPSRFIKADGYLMRVPTIDVAEVGSGAGSIAWLDGGNLLNAGPQSAGAFPGPACYGQGGDKPTVTDSNVALGFLPSKLAGGTMELDVQRSRDAIARDIAGPLGLTVEEAALGVREIVNVNMARAIRAVTVERGVDPRDFTLLAIGGSGPVHACDLAQALGIRRVLFPRAPGVFTAMGMLAGNVERYFLRPLPGLLAETAQATVAATMADLRAEAVKGMAEEGYGAEAIGFVYEFDLRYRGQDSELQVEISEAADFDAQAIRAKFLEVYAATYGYASQDAVEVVNLRLRAMGLSGQNLDFKALKSGQLTARGQAQDSRRIHFSRDSGWVDTPVIDRSALDRATEGPLVLQSSDTTIIVPPGATAAPDAAGNVLVTFG